MNTTTINTGADKGNGKNMAAQAAKAAASAGVGFGAAYAVHEMGKPEVEEEVVEQVVEQDTTNDTQQQTQTSAPTSGQHPTNTQQATQPTQTTQPTQPTQTAETPVPDSQQTTPTEQTSITSETTPTQPEEPAQPPVEQVNEPVNPDEIAEAIIAEEQIDPTDIDADNIVIFDEVREEYNAYGERETVALFHDNEGNELVMVDVDNDQVFDIVTDTGGDFLGFVDDAGITVHDAEVSLADENTYVGYTDDMDDDSNFCDESLLDDMLC